MRIFGYSVFSLHHVMKVSFGTAGFRVTLLSAHLITTDKALVGSDRRVGIAHHVDIEDAQIGMAGRWRIR